MDSELLRGVMFFAGLGVSAHHLAAAAALKRAPHIVKGLSMPLTVASGVGMVVMAVVGNVPAALQCALGMVIGMGITEIMVWRAGAFISHELDRQAEIHERARRQVDQLKSALWADWEIIEAMQDKEEHHETTRARD